MKIKYGLFIFFLILGKLSVSQTNAVFGREIPVAVSGLTFDAMEPFISPNGNTLFFNSLNSGGNTNLYYATKINDSSFAFSGLVGGTYDSSPNHLDGVASLDTANTFFWVSLRAFPNLHKGKYSAGSVTNITRTFGDFNITTQGWIIMDAAISFQGDLLYYCNAYFGPTFSECPGMPCKARLGVAKKINDSTFYKLANTDGIFSNVNDTNYIVYAPQVTKDGLELHYTRILKSTVNSQLCLSVRESISDTFSHPIVLYSNNGFVPEAASPAADNMKLYYHQKKTNGLFGIFLRYRIDYTAIEKNRPALKFALYPNPTSSYFLIVSPIPGPPPDVVIYSPLGKELMKCSRCSEIDVSGLSKGMYFLTITLNNVSETFKVIRD